MKRLIVAFLLSLPMLAFAQSKMSPLTRIYKNAQEDATTDAQRVSLRKTYNVATIDGTDYVSGFLYLDGSKEELEEYGVLFNSDFDTIFTVQIPTSQLDNVLALESVKRFELGQSVKPTMKNARAKANVDDVYNGTGVLTRGYKGTGVAIGIVDIGFQFDHINFYKEDYSESRIKAAWNQNKAGSSSNHPSGYNYGIEYGTPAKAVAAKKDGTSEAHATHVAGIAGGATSYGNYRGVAPNADLYFVSTDCSDNGILDGVEYIFKKVGSEPCVVNLSLGSHLGPHDGTSTFDRLTSAMIDQHKILVGSAGNEGGDYLHVGKTFSATDTVMRAVLKETYSGYGADTYQVDIWGDDGMNYTFSFVIIDNSGEVVYATDPIDARVTKSTSVTLKSKTSYATAGSIRYASELNSYNNKGNVLLSISSKITLLGSGYSYGIEIKSKEEGTVNAWIQGDYWSFYHASASLGGLTKGDNNMSVGEVGGVGNQIISVGSFNSGTTTGSNTNTTMISDFSSLGPTADGRMKPDVVAPGCIITSSINGYVISSKSEMIDYSGVGIFKTETVNDTKYYYGGMQGTSMSSPFVTGVIALWLENARWLDTEQIRSILKKTSTSDTYTGVCPNNTAGYGKIDALQGLLETFTYSSIPEIEASAAELIVYPNPVVDELKVFFPKTDKNVTISVFGVNGQVVYNQHFDTIHNLQTESINFTNVASGMYIIRITGEKTNECFKINK